MCLKSGFSVRLTSRKRTPRASDRGRTSEARGVRKENLSGASLRNAPIITAGIRRTKRRINAGLGIIRISLATDELAANEPHDAIGGTRKKSARPSALEAAFQKSAPLNCVDVCLGTPSELSVVRHQSIIPGHLVSYSLNRRLPATFVL